MRVVEAVGVGIGIGVSLYSTYALKVALNINLDIAGKEHFPAAIERSTHGLIKCKWFPNSHHCPHKKE